MHKHLIITVLLSFLLCACVGAQQQPTTRVGNPAVSVEVDSVGSSFVRLDVQLASAEKAWLMVLKGRETVSSAEELKEKGRSFAQGLHVWDGLEFDTQYTVFACAESSDGRLGIVESTSFKTWAGDLYAWEKNRTGIPFFADLALLYGGQYRTPRDWTEERLRPFVTWTDPETGQEKWLFDAFLALEMRTASYPPHTYVVGMKDWEDPSMAMRAADQADAMKFLDYWFAEGNGFRALDKVVVEAIGRIGAPKASIKVIVMMPDISIHERYNVPASSTTYWGKVGGRQLDFSSVEDRRQAYYWYVDEVRRRFSQAAFQHIELGGFYIMTEELPNMRSGKGGRGGDMIDGQMRDGWEVKAKAWDDVFPAVSEYIHQYHESVCWIPYRAAAGYRYWKEFGIDYAWMQPNYYWDTFGANPMSSFFPAINTYDLAMELEMDDLMMPHPVDRKASEYTKEKDGKTVTETWKDYSGRWRAYIEGMQSAGVYGRKPLALYQDTDSFNHLLKSSDPEAQAAFQELCRLIAEDPLKEKNR